MSEKEIKKRISWATLAFPNARVKNYEPLMKGLNLPDIKDRHVLAAAIKTKATLIVTNNLKDFPKEYLATFKLIAKNPDDFLVELIKLHPDRAVHSFKKLVLNRQNPNLNEFQVLEALKRNGLLNTSDSLQALL